MPLQVVINNTPIVYPDYFSIEFTVAGRKAQGGITEINYSDNVERGQATANQRQVLGKTPGMYKADDGSFSIHMEDGQEIIDLLSPGFYDKIFDILVAYQMPRTNRIVRDTLAKVQLKKQDHAHKSGTDPLVKKFEFELHYILWNGQNPLLRMRL